MKTLPAVFFLVFCLIQMPVASPDYFFETNYHNAVAENLKFLNNKFPDKPGKGYPWLTVTINHKKAIVICPEDGLGDALLVFEDGTVKRKSARSEGVKLCYHAMIKPESGEKWHELQSVSGWEPLRIEKNDLFAESVARHFTNAFFKAVFKVEVEK